MQLIRRNDDPERKEGAMQIKIAAAFAFVLAASACSHPPQPPVVQNGWLTYRTSYTSATIHCGDQPIALAGDHTSLQLVGSCTNVRLAGSHNDVEVDIVPGGEITITGSHNDLTWHRAAPGPPPHLTDQGKSNTFHHPAP
jgi:Protein of unknown function (DUF3060)